MVQQVRISSLKNQSRSSSIRNRPGSPELLFTTFWDRHPVRRIKIQKCCKWRQNKGWEHCDFYNGICQYEGKYTKYFARFLEAIPGHSSVLPFFICVSGFCFANAVRWFYVWILLPGFANMVFETIIFLELTCINGEWDKSPGKCTKKPTCDANSYAACILPQVCHDTCDNYLSQNKFESWKIWMYDGPNLSRYCRLESMDKQRMQIPPES